MARRVHSPDPAVGRLAAPTRAAGSTPTFATTGMVISGVAHFSLVAALVAQWWLGGTVARVVPPPRGVVSLDLQASWSTSGSGREGRQPLPVQITSPQPAEESLTARAMPVSRLGRLPPSSGERSTGEAPDPESAPTATQRKNLQEAETLPDAPSRDQLPAFPRSRRAVRAGLEARERNRVEAWTPPSASSRRSDGARTEAQPTTVFSPQPTYPPELLAAGISGQVKLRVEVLANGRVGRVSVYRSSGQAELDRAALEAVRRWRFEPARRAGVPVQTEIAVPVRFTIRR